MCYNRFVRWHRAGVWGGIAATLSQASNSSLGMIDSSVIRVHQHGASIRDNRAHSIGRSRGGLTRKINAVLDGRGVPIRVALSAGQDHDTKPYRALLSGLKPGTIVLDDRGYDADWLRSMVFATGEAPSMYRPGAIARSR